MVEAAAAPRRVRRSIMDIGSSGTDQGAAALPERAEGLVGGGGGDGFVVVPRPLALGRGLDLPQIGGVQLAPVRADAAGAEAIVVGRVCLHLVVCGCAVLLR